jgi:hypothetical protein
MLVTVEVVSDPFGPHSFSSQLAGCSFCYPIFLIILSRTTTAGGPKGTQRTGGPASDSDLRVPRPSLFVLEGRGFCRYRLRETQMTYVLTCSYRAQNRICRGCPWRVAAPLPQAPQTPESSSGRPRAGGPAFDFEFLGAPVFGSLKAGAFEVNLVTGINVWDRCGPTPNLFSRKRKNCSKASPWDEPQVSSSPDSYAYTEASRRTSSDSTR